MPFVPVADTVMAELRYSLDGQRVENTLYFSRAGGWAIADLPPLYNMLLIWWTTELSQNISDDCVFNEIAFTDLSDVAGFSVQIATPTPHPTGQTVFPSAPNNVSLAVSFRTLRRGRSFRGRNFVAGLADTDILQSHLAGAVVSAIEGYYADLITLAATGGWSWVVVSRISGGDDRVAGIATPISSVIVLDDVVDSQRRRLPGRGT